MLATCIDCGARFSRSAGEDWRVRCEPCWRAGRKTHRPSLPPATHATASPIDPARLRQLLQLCHPDRHGGSALACDITQWLLSMRAAARAQA